MHQDPIAAAQTLLAAGRQNEAIAAIDRAAATGHAGALFQRAFWHLVGQPVPRDLPRARADLRRAVAGGHREARLMEITLAANGTGAPADWSGSMALLRSAAEGDRDAAALLHLLDAMTLDAGGAPRQLPPIESLTPDGSVARVPRLLTPAECAHIANSAADLLAPAFVVDPRTGRSVPHPIRTSDAAVIGPLREDPVIRAINHRLAEASRTPIGAGEALTVLRYQPGQQFRLHSDILPQTRNQRVTTVLVYLNDGFTGGETVFPDHGLTVAPRTGDAVIFTNVDAAGRPAAAARHAGMPVRSGVKWLATRWIRARAFDVWQGPEAA